MTAPTAWHEAAVSGKPAQGFVPHLHMSKKLDFDDMLGERVDASDMHRDRVEGQFASALLKDFKNPMRHRSAVPPSRIGEAEETETALCSEPAKLTPSRSDDGWACRWDESR